ncbi:MAG: hrpB 2 [Frankiales bacterium]|nr:hrpB 2 [Frankiales bacterium]
MDATGSSDGAADLGGSSAPRTVAPGGGPARAPIGDRRLSVADLLGPGRSLPDPLADPGPRARTGDAADRQSTSRDRGPRRERPDRAQERRGPDAPGGRHSSRSPDAAARPDSSTDVADGRRSSPDVADGRRSSGSPDGSGGRPRGVVDVEDGVSRARTGPPVQAGTGETAADLLARLASTSLRDEHRLQRRLDTVRKQRDPERLAQLLASLARDVSEAEARLAARRASVPRIAYPDLPVAGRREDILEAVRDNQVVVLAGETGSGKTTQLPKMMLELGRGVRGLIGHTQPRRLAARTVAERIADELGTPLGQTVGYKVRFTDTSSDRTLVRLMTDGILLAEVQRDRMLRAYDTIIVDEAHERSLNIDFLLGYLAQLLPRRPDLKLVITSATIETERFSRHFGGAPVIEVTGRTYPVEVRYRPLVEEAPEAQDEDDEPAEPRIARDPVQAICDAVDELQRAGDGDVLVFLSGEREIRDTADALQRTVRPGTEVVPLYARLSSAEQHRVFESHSERRVVLATNVAETSLTVPGIRYVVDPGTARISRYSLKTKVQRLPIEPVSQASANQRKGRCGRVAEGICIRLYSEEDFASRPEFTDPEIQRTNLASVILQMASLGLGEVSEFPFVDPPDRRQIKDGVDLLHELGALDVAEPDPAKRLTTTGRRLAALPLDPRLGRMVLEADRNGCVSEVMVIAAALSIQDPRERPVDKQAQAQQLHARFRDETSDFASYLNLWRYLNEQREELSGNQFRRLCKAEFLHYLRVREWQDLHGQLLRVVRDLGIEPHEVATDTTRLHQSLLAGLLSHIGVKDEAKNEYTGARSARFAVFPGSALARKPPRWVVAAELVETSRLWGRTAARISPEWIEPLAEHLVKRSYSEPHWEKKAAAVMAWEKVTLYGVPIVAKRKVAYGRIDPEVSRDLFLRHALVEGARSGDAWDTHHAFFAHNRALLQEVEELTERARRTDVVVDDETLYDFYDARIPADVVSGRHFDAWWKQTKRSVPQLLDFTRELLVQNPVAPGDYPDAFVQGPVRLQLDYRFEPGAPADGVTVEVPLESLNQVDPTAPEWQVPGLREELVVALIKSLPKQLRKHVVPAPNFAKAFLADAVPYASPVREALAADLRRRTGVLIGPDDWDLSKVPPHLRPTYRVVDAEGRQVAEGQDLAELRRRLAPRLTATLSQAAGALERSGLRDWDLGSLPRTFEGGPVRGYPSLVDEGSSVGVKVLPDAAAQTRSMLAGTRRLLLLTVPGQTKAVVGRLTNAQKLALARNPHGGVPALLEDCLSCAVDTLVVSGGGPVWDEAAFDRLRDHVRAGLFDVLLEVVTVTERVLATAADVEERLAALRGQKALEPALADVRNQLQALVHPGFVTETGLRRLSDLRRYLTAMVRRLDKLPTDPQRDRLRMLEVQQLEQDRQALLAKLPVERRTDQDVDAVRWMVEELRVSHFGQGLRTSQPVSETRILKAMDALLP